MPMIRFVCLIWLLTTTAVWSADHRISASAGGVEALFASGKVKGGDRVLLAPGDYGALHLTGLRFSPPVTVSGETADQPRLTQLTIKNSSGVQFKALRLRPDPDAPQITSLINIVSSDDILIEGVDISSAADANGWSVEDWQRRAHHGIRADGRNIVLRNNSLNIVDFGITTLGQGARVEGNTITMFAGDGIRGLGDESIYSGNTIETCVKINSNHDDGFQSWSLDANGKAGAGVVRNVQVLNNVIRNGTGPFPCTLQGIGLFDGMYEDWIISGNVIEVNQWHGITVFGANRVHILDNIVVDSDSGRAPGPPWITIMPHRDGRAVTDSLIAGNVTQPFAGGKGSRFGKTQPGVVYKDNIVVPTAFRGLALQR